MWVGTYYSAGETLKNSKPKKNENKNIKKIVYLRKAICKNNSNKYKSLVAATWSIQANAKKEIKA